MGSLPSPVPWRPRVMPAPTPVSGPAGTNSFCPDVGLKEHTFLQENPKVRERSRGEDVGPHIENGQCCPPPKNATCGGTSSAMAAPTPVVLEEAQRRGGSTGLRETKSG